MKLLQLIAIFTLLPFFSYSADEKAFFNPIFNRSLFPLQEQVLHYGKNIEFKDTFCKSEGMIGVFRIKNVKGQIQYECAGYTNAECGLECFNDNVYLGEYYPDIYCEGELFDEVDKSSGTTVLKRQVCENSVGNVIWERNSDDKIVFDNIGRLRFVKDEKSFGTYRQNKLKRFISYSKDELIFYDAEIPDDYIHVKYQYDNRGRVTKEMHFNKERFPYVIYEAQYNVKGNIITKIDGYTNKRTEYLFK